ncbi:hypothetical protein AB8615_01020 [Litorimonas sp. RW-G-Af-16]|uniref:hypothetical protein n=1 Tax=Litorimonas sp. RW-G-Af-16 TaxID=3241168 RepID=UPI003AAEF77A
MNELGSPPHFFDDLTRYKSPADVTDALCALYDEAITDLNTAFKTYAETGERPLARASPIPIFFYTLGRRKKTV